MVEIKELRNDLRLRKRFVLPLRTQVVSVLVTISVPTGSESASEHIASNANNCIPGPKAVSDGDFLPFLRGDNTGDEILSIYQSVAFVLIRSADDSSVIRHTSGTLEWGEPLG